ncbi:oxygen-independent coproporphyrinogen III oxidase [Limibaculum sp. M0105]|uniref:Coproporphyrinogen-III oxidase n=2 Tax=Thermohalobaculum xanthum TaxID=2753746 RepID=A0A8J7SGN4_9RHOB|nr:oxygen-independent coproporphyrinogen III oxidase [Thermohalobaculum xanthum]
MMSQITAFEPDALERSVPRYTSYPTAPHFTDGVCSATYRRWLGELAPDAKISLYLHIPFCDELCWFCACRTQGSRNYRPVSRYLDLLIAEIDQVAGLLGPDHPISQVHWGGGSPTILSPDDMYRLSTVIHERFPLSQNAEFAVEIDPRDMTEPRLDALAAAGLSRASIGVQDFEPRVQAAIGRRQGYDITKKVIDGLRARGVTGINIDLLYGLPGQTAETLMSTIEKVIGLGPDRLALFGYAHVPWMARRQKMIDESILPGTTMRRRQATLAAQMLREAGYAPIGIDHFAKPADAMALAAADGSLRRNFQGYTVDPAVALIGMGASAIGSMPQGYVQNDPSTAGYQKAIEAGKLATTRGKAFTADDRARRDAIEQILCRFALDPDAVTTRHGIAALPVCEIAEALLAAAPEGALIPKGRGFVIADGWRSHTRLIAAEFDAYFQNRPARHSLAV